MAISVLMRCLEEIERRASHDMQFSAQVHVLNALFFLIPFHMYMYSVEGDFTGLHTQKAYTHTGQTWVRSRNS